MGLFRFGKKGQAESPADELSPECPHTALTPHWNSVGQMGNQEAVSSYICDSCQESFSSREGGQLIENQAERLRLQGLRAG
jgi:hypothetical protein